MRTRSAWNYPRRSPDLLDVADMRSSVPTPGVDPRSSSIEKDRVGEELSDSARIWKVYDDIAKDEDKKRIANWNRGLDNLAIFAALFSAVTTAFIIEAQKDMKPDYAQLTFLVLNSTASGARVTIGTFTVPSSARTVTCLWVTSLILSLSAALIAIMGKDWIGMYSARPACNPRQWAEMRTYRLLCVEKWHMSGVIAAAPVLLHFSLLLFGGGLVLFLSSDPFTYRLTLGLWVVASALYILMSLSAIVFSSSPFRSPATQMLRILFIASVLYFRDVLFYRPKPDTLRELVEAVNGTLDLPPIPRGNQAGSPPTMPPQSASHRVAASPLGGFDPYGDDFDTYRRMRWPFHDGAGNSVDRVSMPNVRRMRAGPPVAPAAYTAMRGAFIQQLSPESPPPVSGPPARSIMVLGDSILVSLHTIGDKLRWSHIKDKLSAVYMAVCRIDLEEILLGSLWSELRTSRSPALMAESLSWLNRASRAPEVFRAVLFALGDLECGNQVGSLVSHDLCADIRADIGRNWQKVDFLILSRYALAHRNLPKEWPAFPNMFTGEQFMARFDVTRDPSLRCEEGLAAVCRMPEICRPLAIRQHCPDHFTQPRIMQLVLPYLAGSSAQTLVFLNCCWATIYAERRIFLKERLLNCLGPYGRRSYAVRIKNKFGGHSGLLELLTFCMLDMSDHTAKRAGADILVHVLIDELTISQRPCLAYVFGSDGLRAAVWSDRNFSEFMLDSLVRHLPFDAGYRWDAREPPFDCEREFQLNLARTAVMLMAPIHPSIDHLRLARVGYICAQISHPGLRDHPEVPGIIRLILEQASLVQITCPIDGWWGFKDIEQFKCCLVILSTVARYITQLISQRSTSDDDKRLFHSFAHSEAKGLDGTTVAWDLGEWLREAPVILEKFPQNARASPARHVKDCYQAVADLYLTSTIRGGFDDHWERIGYAWCSIDTLLDPSLPGLDAFFGIDEGSTNAGIHETVI